MDIFCNRITYITCLRNSNLSKRLSNIVVQKCSFSHYFRDAKLPSSRYHLDLPLKSFYTEITELSLLEWVRHVSSASSVAQAPSWEPAAPPADNFHEWTDPATGAWVRTRRVRDEGATTAGTLCVWYLCDGGATTTDTLYVWCIRDLGRDDHRYVMYLMCTWRGRDDCRYVMCLMCTWRGRDDCRYVMCLMCTWRGRDDYRYVMCLIRTWRGRNYYRYVMCLI